MAVRRLMASIGSLIIVSACGSQSGSPNPARSAGSNAVSGSSAAVASSGTLEGTSGSVAIGPTSGVGSGSTSGDVGAAGSSASSGTVGGSVAGTSAGSAAASGTESSEDAGTSSEGSVTYPAMVDAGVPTPLGDQTLPRKLYIENRCTYPIWSFALPPSTFPNSVPLEAAPGQAFVVGWPNQWQGRIWGRTECTGQGNVTCAVTNGPDTLAEFALTEGMASDWYDISLVDGFTIPTAIIQIDAPWTQSPAYVSPVVDANGDEQGGKLGADSICGSPVCAADLLANCPASQQKKDAIGNVVACKNGDPGVGPIASYFKSGCPTSYSWPLDDPQSLFRCPDSAQNNGVGAKDYKIIYCPTQGSTPGFP